MRNYHRFAVLMAIIGACVLFAGDAVAQDKVYQIYFQSNRDGQSAIYHLGGSDGTSVAGPRCEYPSVTADGSILLYTKWEQTDWGQYWNMFYLKDGKEYKLTANFVYDELEPNKLLLRCNNNPVGISDEKPLTRAVRAFAEAVATGKTDWRFGADIGVVTTRILHTAETGTVHA